MTDDEKRRCAVDKIRAGIAKVAAGAAMADPLGTAYARGFEIGHVFGCVAAFAEAELISWEEAEAFNLEVVEARPPWPPE